MRKLILFLTLFILGCGPDSDPQPVAPQPTNTAAIAGQDTQLRYLGQCRDVDGTLLEGFAFLHPRRANGRENGQGGGNNRKDKVSSCFSFISGSKVVWKVAEPYLIDPSNRANLATLFVTNSVHQAIWSWDNQVGTTIFGPETLGLVDRASIGNTANGQNELIFDTIDYSGVIAVTYVWGIFSGPPRNRELKEWDMVFNDVDFQWGDAGPLDETNLGNTQIMDFLNILMHEVGHCAGLGHPTDDCTEETMFRYATGGETKKRTLHTGDIAGVKELYN